MSLLLKPCSGLSLAYSELQLLEDFPGLLTWAYSSLSLSPPNTSLVSTIPVCPPFALTSYIMSNLSDCFLLGFHLLWGQFPLIAPCFSSELHISKHTWGFLSSTTSLSGFLFYTLMARCIATVPASCHSSTCQACLPSYHTRGSARTDWLCHSPNTSFRAHRLTGTQRYCWTN